MIMLCGQVTTGTEQEFFGDAGDDRNTGGALTPITVTATDQAGARAGVTFLLVQGDTTVSGTPDQDALTGTDTGSEIFFGLGGGDFLEGGRGVGVYIVSAGEGPDEIAETSSDVGEALVLERFRT